MRKYSLLLLLIGLPFMVSCQEPFVAPDIQISREFPIRATVQTLWEVKSDRSSFGKYACELDDGTIMIVGGALSNLELPPLYIARYSPDGELLWDSTYSQLQASNGSRVTQLSDGTVLVVTTSDDGGIVLLDLSKSGSLQWTEVYRSKGSRYVPYALLPTFDAGVIVCGLNDIDFDYDDGFILKFDRAGKLSWEHAIRGEEEDAAEAILLAEDGSNDVLVSGHSYSPGGKQDLIVNRYSQTGEVIWTKRYATASSWPGMSLTYDRLKHQYVASGGQSYDKETSYAGKFVHFDGSGNETSRRYYRHTESIPMGMFAADSGFFMYEDDWLHFVGLSDTTSKRVILPDLQEFRYSLTQLRNGDFLAIGLTPPFAEGSEARLLLRRFKMQ